MSENNFWLSVWGVVGLVVMVSMQSCTSYYKDKNTKIVEAIKGGANPFEVVCAMGDENGDNPTCVITASKTKKEK